MFISIFRALSGSREKTKTPPKTKKTRAARVPVALGPIAVPALPVVQHITQVRGCPDNRMETELDLYESHDPLPVPQTSEHSCDEIWSAFQYLQQSTYSKIQRDDGHVSALLSATVPTCVAGLIPMNQSVAGYAAEVHPSKNENPEISKRSNPSWHPTRSVVKIDDVIAIARHRNRACPKPQAWSRICAELGHASLLADAGAPPEPISRADWPRTTFLTKRAAFRKVIDWSAAVGCLPELQQLMLGMPESEWQYLD